MRIRFPTGLRAALALLLYAPSALANPFTGAKPSGAAAAANGFGLPFAPELMAWQRQIHEALTARIEMLRDGESLAPLWALLAIGFAYGVFHVLAPGHGKVIVGSYFLGHQARWKDGVWAGLIMAVGHTVTAVAVVLVLYLLLGGSQMGILADARYVELAGYGLIAMIGLWMLRRALKKDGGTGCAACGHHHDHHHHHGAEDHGHQEPISLLEDRSALSLFATASLVPCTGSMIILLFTLAGHILWAGILAVIAIALGMWLTVTVIGIASMLLRRAIVGSAAGRRASWQRRAARALGIFAALLVTLTGGLLFLGVWQSM